MCGEEGGVDGEGVDGEGVGGEGVDGEGADGEGVERSWEGQTVRHCDFV